jgi:hypothetical protein
MIRPFLKQELFTPAHHLEDILISGSKALAKLLVRLLPI